MTKRKLGPRVPNHDRRCAESVCPSIHNNEIVLYRTISLGSDQAGLAWFAPFLWSRSCKLLFRLPKLSNARSPWFSNVDPAGRTRMPGPFSTVQSLRLQEVTARIVWQLPLERHRRIYYQILNLNPKIS